MFRPLFVLAAIVFAASMPAAPSQESSYYTTCPDFEQAVVRNVAYVPVSESDLLKWATKRVHPKPHGSQESVQVSLEIEGDHIFCASALNGSPEKQKAAVESALKWRFKKKRGNFHDDIIGSLTFRF